MKDKPDVVYICRGYGMDCYMEPYCVYRGDPIAATDEVCSHTLNPNFSLHGECKDPENHPERFTFYERPDDCKPDYYWEEERDGTVLCDYPN